MQGALTDLVLKPVFPALNWLWFAGVLSALILPCLSHFLQPAAPPRGSGGGGEEEEEERRRRRRRGRKRRGRGEEEEEGREREREEEEGNEERVLLDQVEEEVREVVKHTSLPMVC